MEDSPLASNSDNLSEREFTSLLIYLYRESPELWRVNSKDYFNRKKRSAALEKIVGFLKTLKPDFTVERLKQKINTLRTNFNREHKAMEEKRLSGADEVAEPSLWYYNELSFIKGQIETTESLTSETSQPQPALQATPPSSTRTAKKRKVQAEFSEAPGCAESFKRPETEEDALAQVWAMKLKKLDPDQRRFAEKIINDTLFEAEMGTLTRHGVRFVTQAGWSPSPPSSSSTQPNCNWPYAPAAQPTYSSSPSGSPSPTETVTYPPAPDDKFKEEPPPSAPDYPSKFAFN